MKTILGLIAIWLISPVAAYGQAPKLSVETPMAPPEWALWERELLRVNTSACQEFFARYVDERGSLLCVERWGGMTCQTTLSRTAMTDGQNEAVY